MISALCEVEKDAPGARLSFPPSKSGSVIDRRRQRRAFEGDVLKVQIRTARPIDGDMGVHRQSVTAVDAGLKLGSPGFRQHCRAEDQTDIKGKS